MSHGTHATMRPGRGTDSDDADDSEGSEDGGTPRAGPVRRVAVHRHEAGTARWSDDEVIAEHPVALVFNGVSHAVMMATPQDLDDFALGFALSEGVIGSAADCHDLETVHGPLGTELRMRIASRAFEALQTRRRAMAGRTGCGLCGIDSLAQLDAGRPRGPLRPAGPLLRPATAAVLRALAPLEAAQVLQARTGGCHAAAWVDGHGELRAVREDVGRHNALDKLIGHLMRHDAGSSLDSGFVLMSSRASYELVSKCARVGIGTLATLSAPTSLAVSMAREAGLQLYGFCRPGRVVDYTGTADSPAVPRKAGPN